MYKIFSFVSLILSMLCFMGLQVLNVIQKMSYYYHYLIAKILTTSIFSGVY